MACLRLFTKGGAVQGMWLVDWLIGRWLSRSNTTDSLIGWWINLIGYLSRQLNACPHAWWEVDRRCQRHAVHWLLDVLIVRLLDSLIDSVNRLVDSLVITPAQGSPPPATRDAVQGMYDTSTRVSNQSINETADPPLQLMYCSIIERIESIGQRPNMKQCIDHIHRDWIINEPLVGSIKQPTTSNRWYRCR